MFSVQYWMDDTETTASSSIYSELANFYFESHVIKTISSSKKQSRKKYVLLHELTDFFLYGGGSRNHVNWIRPPVKK